VSKPKVALYWCASCGGCEETVVDLDAGLLHLAEEVDIVLWPVATDFKYDDVRALADGEIAVSFINGAIRTDEQADVARLLRDKSQLVVAFGSCAHLGGIPGLANLTSRQEIFATSYGSSPTVDNPEAIVPLTQIDRDGRSLSLPAFWERVHSLDQLIAVDYYLPGCPPPPGLVKSAIEAILSGNLPPRGETLAPKKALCDTCPRRETRNPETRLDVLHRPHEVIARQDLCFLEQGILCCGPATRSGCGEACIHGNMPCTGCFGPTPEVIDQGAKLLSAIATLFGTDTEAAARELAGAIVDPAGTFYRYAVPVSRLAGKVR
jgi:F420-non-reducing hydrogenase small subunit